MAFKLFKRKSSKKSKKAVEEVAPAPVEDKPLLQEPEPKPEPEEAEVEESPSVASESPSEEIPKEEEKESWMSKMTMNCCV